MVCCRSPLDAIKYIHFSVVSPDEVSLLICSCIVHSFCRCGYKPWLCRFVKWRCTKV